MNQQLATTSATALEVVKQETLTNYLDSMGLAAKLTQAEKTQFLQIAQAWGLNPFKREIYCTKFGEGQYAQFSIVVGYETYLKRAERTGKMDGIEYDFAGAGDDLQCTVRIYRKDWSRPFSHVAFYSECVQTTKDNRPNRFWTKMPRTMLRKTAMSQAFRLAFPDEMGGLPYTNDELGVEIVDAPHVDVTESFEAKPVTTSQPTYEAKIPNGKKETAEWARKLNDWQKGILDCNTLEDFEEHREAMKPLGLQKNDLIANFGALKKQAETKGFTWSKEASSFQPFDAETGEVITNATA